jgi:ubiquinone biosynthesis O-methyltransferase
MMNTLKGILFVRNTVNTIFRKTRSPRLSLSTSNDDEVHKFSNISASWWDSNSLSGAGPLHTMNPCRVGYIRSALVQSYEDLLKKNAMSSPLRGLKILDVGCGGGLLSESLARLGGQVTGIDPSPELIAVAKDHGRHDPSTQSITYLSTTVDKLPDDPENQYDVVCSLEVLLQSSTPLRIPYGHSMSRSSSMWISR